MCLCIFCCGWNCFWSMYSIALWEIALFFHYIIDNNLHELMLGELGVVIGKVSHPQHVDCCRSCVSAGRYEKSLSGLEVHCLWLTGSSASRCCIGFLIWLLLPWAKRSDFQSTRKNSKSVCLRLIIDYRWSLSNVPDNLRN